MMCYRDRTYCASPKCKNACGRQFTPQDHASAVKWWGGEDYPVSVSDFCDEEGNLNNGGDLHGDGI